MVKNIPIYEVTFDSEVTAISLVEYPAIEKDFVYLSKEEDKKKIVLSSDEKMMVYGPALIANFPIYRIDQTTNEEYYIVFSAETIEQLAHNFISEGRIQSFTTQHESKTRDVSVYESWIKTSENDKSNDLGFDCPLGTWFIGCKIHSMELWKQIKEGDLRGFSVEAYIGLNEIEFNKINNKEEKMEETITVNDNFWSKLLETFKTALKTPEHTEEENIVTEEPVQTSEQVVEMAEEQVVVEEPETAEEIAEEVVETVVMEEPTVEDAENKLQDVVDELNKKIDELNEEIETLKKENAKLSKQPEVKPVSTRQSNQNNQSNFDRMLAIMNGDAYRK